MGILGVIWFYLVGLSVGYGMLIRYININIVFILFQYT